MENSLNNSVDSKVVYRFYTVWQDEQEEDWLRQMSLQGWHLVKVSLATRYLFIRGESKNYYYRLDYVNSFSGSKEDYIRFFKDMGWIHIASIANGWQYFRTENKVDFNSSPEIYTDKNSKIEKNLRIQKVLAFVFILNLVIGLNNLFTGISQFKNLSNTKSSLSLLNLGCAAVLAYALYKIAVRIKLLKSKF